MESDGYLRQAATAISAGILPEYFNFGATIDAFAADPARVALLWEDQDGNRARLTFADIRDQSNRIANVLTGTGHQARRSGDAGAAADHAVAGGLYRRAQGRRDRGPVRLDVAREGPGLSRQPFAARARSSPAPDSAEMVGDLRSQCPSLAHYLVGGQPRAADGRRLQEAMKQASPTFRPRAIRAADDPAICYYTSGTTKDPKAVLHGHAYTYSASIHRAQLGST